MNKIDLITQPIIKFQDSGKGKLKIDPKNGSITVQTDNVQQDDTLSTNIFLISPESGKDIKMGDIFLTVPDYDVFYICTDIDGEKITGRQISYISDEIFYVYDNNFEFKLYNARKVIATGDECPFDLPKLSEESINEIVQNYNENNEGVYHITFEVDNNSMNVQTNDLGEVDLIQKTEEEKEKEGEALNFWDNHIRPELEKINTCGDIKLLAMFLEKYKNNPDLFKKK